MKIIITLQQQIYKLQFGHVRTVPTIGSLAQDAAPYGNARRRIHTGCVATFALRCTAAPRSTATHLVWMIFNCPLVTCIGSRKKRTFPPVTLSFSLWPLPRQCQNELPYQVLSGDTDTHRTNWSCWQTIEIVLKTSTSLRYATPVASNILSKSIWAVYWTTKWTICASFALLKDKDAFSFRGRRLLIPWPWTSAPGPCWGLRLQTPKSSYVVNGAW